MPRSATDATRFTSTIPHQSKAQLPSKGQPPRKPTAPSPKGETPQEKVRRLRAAADRARDAQISTFDKVIIRGRVWADRAHKVVTLSLIAATGTASFPRALTTELWVCVLDQKLIGDLQWLPEVLQSTL